MSETNQKTGARITRRTVLLAGGAAALTLAAPHVRRASAQENVLYVNTWGGNWEAAAKESFFDPFTKESGIEILTVSPISVAKLAAQVRTGVYEFDVTTLGLADLARANTTGLLESAEGKIDPASVWENGLVNNGLGTHAFANVIAYHGDKFPSGGPQNWADFWNTEKFPGPRSLQKYAARVIAFALMADGVTPDKLFPYDLDRAFASLDKIKPHIRVWWTAGPQSTQLLADNEVDLAGIWDDNANEAKKQDPDIVTTFNQALIDVGCWVVAKGTPRAENGWKFIQSIANNAEGLARFCQIDGSGPMNPKAIALVEPDFAKRMPTSPENMKNAVILDGTALVSQLDEIAERFDRWIAL
jgi:putative spermidine/putrescine transport system substrate-binding protein